MTPIRMPKDTLILIGDGEKAMFLRNRGDEAFPNLVVERLFEHENPPTREQGADHPGRVNDALGRKSAVENSDWHRIEKERFAKELAERLYKSAHAGQFQHLIVVAPPQVLGNLRNDFHAEVKSRIVAEVDKTLTQHPVHEIERLLTGGKKK
jgi:protein required for attachment to host cells